MKDGYLTTLYKDPRNTINTLIEVHQPRGYFIFNWHLITRYSVIYNWYNI
jgi:hypothetical protein